MKTFHIRKIWKHSMNLLYDILFVLVILLMNVLRLIFFIRRILYFLFKILMVSELQI